MLKLSYMLLILYLFNFIYETYMVYIHHTNIVRTIFSQGYFYLRVIINTRSNRVGIVGNFDLERLLRSICFHKLPLLLLYFNSLYTTAVSGNSFHHICYIPKDYIKSNILKIIIFSNAIQLPNYLIFSVCNI